MPGKVKLAGGLEKTVTWVWLTNDGQFKVEFYDFTEDAQKMFGNDIAYTIKVKEMSRLLSFTGQSEISLVPWMAENFQSYFGIKKWLEENGVEYDIERESWA